MCDDDGTVCPWEDEQMKLLSSLLPDPSSTTDSVLPYLPPLPHDHPSNSPSVLFAGCDLTEPTNQDLPSIASYVILDSSLETVHESHVEVTIQNPYVPGFLSFREAPPVLPSILSAPPPNPNYLLCDGNGILHPRGVGFASHLGILLSSAASSPIPTIGVGKNLHAFENLRTSLYPDEDVTAKMIKSIFRAYLLSPPTSNLDHYSIVNLDVLPPSFLDSTDAPAPNPLPSPIASAILYLYSNNQFDVPCGVAYLNSNTSNVNPIFISSGYGVSLRESVWIVHRLSIFRVPEPIRRADKGGREKIRLAQRATLTKNKTG